MVRMIGMLFVILVIVSGCGESHDLELREVESEVDSIIGRLGRPNLNDPWHAYMTRVQAVTNPVLRAKYCMLQRRKLLQVELLGEDFESLSRMFDQVAIGLAPNPSTKPGTRWLVEDDCKAQIEKLSWMRRQLDRWRSFGERHWRDRTGSDDENRRAWCFAYRHCLGVYETALLMLEKRFDAYCLMLKATPEDRARARTLIESFLGRSIRSKDEMAKAWQLRCVSDEMKAIK